MARPSRPLRVALLASLLCFTVEPYPSEAQASPAPSPPDCTLDAACEPLRERASVASKAGNLAEALRLYKLAYGAAPDPRLIFNIARLQQRLDQTEEAIRTYQQFLRAPALEDADQPTRVLLAQQYLQGLQGASRSPDSGSRAAAQKSSTPVYKTWWFWTVVGVAAAGVATGIGLGIASREPDTTGLMEYRP